MGVAYVVPSAPPRLNGRLPTHYHIEGGRTLNPRIIPQWHSARAKHEHYGEHGYATTWDAAIKLREKIIEGRKAYEQKIRKAPSK